MRGIFVKAVFRIERRPLNKVMFVRFKSIAPGGSDQSGRNYILYRKVKGVGGFLFPDGNKDDLKTHHPSPKITNNDDVLNKSMLF